MSSDDSKIYIPSDLWSELREKNRTNSMQNEYGFALCRNFETNPRDLRVFYTVFSRNFDLRKFRGDYVTKLSEILGKYLLKNDVEAMLVIVNPTWKNLGCPDDNSLTIFAELAKTPVVGDRLKNNIYILKGTNPKIYRTCWKNLYETGVRELKKQEELVKIIENRTPEEKALDEALGEKIVFSSENPYSLVSLFAESITLNEVRKRNV